jgi:hypothetical protein
VKRRQQQGSVLTLVMLGILAAGVLATIAYTSYYQIARGTMDTVNRAQSSALLTQATYILAAEAKDSDSDGVLEPLAGVLRLSDGLNDGWAIPAASGAPKVDAWGSSIKYCPWDNGSVISITDRLAGANPANQNQSSLQFALISAGPDKVFATTCADVWAGGATTLPKGDDGVRTMTIADMNRGVTYLLGDPVANLSLLPVSGTPAGTMRVATDTQITYLWNGSSWLPLGNAVGLVDPPVVANTSCSAYPPGMLVRDASGNLWMCKSELDKTWKKVSP